MPCSLTKSSDCVCPRSNTAKQKRKHRIGIIRPLLCFLSVIGFRVLAFAGHRNDGPDRYQDLLTKYNIELPTETLQKLCDGLGITIIDFFNDDLFKDIEPEVK